MRICNPLALLALAGTAIAQGPLVVLGAELGGSEANHSGPDLDDRDPYVLGKLREWPQDPITPTATGPFTRAIAGRFTGHGIADVVALDGSSAVLIAAPAIHTHIASLSGTTGMVICDAATLVGGHRDGQPLHDAIALCGPNGLSIWHSGSPGAVVPVTNTWSNVVRLASHATDTAVIYGIDTGGRVLCAVEQSNGSFALSAAGATTGTLLDLAAIDWNGDGLADLAALTSTALTVRSRTGAVLASFANPDPAFGDLCTLVRRTTGPHASLAWLHADASGRKVVTLCDTTQNVDCRLYEQTGNPYVGITAGAFLAGFDDDLFLSCRGNDAITVLGRQTAGAPFVHDSSTAFKFAVAATGTCDDNAVAPVLGDLDADGDLDLVQLRSEETIPTAMLLKTKYYHRPLGTAQVPATVHGNTSTIDYTPVATSSHTQFIVWRIGDKGDLQPSAIFTALVATTATTQTIAVPFYPLIGPDGMNLAILIRPVQVAGGEVVEVGEASLLTLSFQTGGTFGGIVIGGQLPLGDIPPPDDGEGEPDPSGS